MSTRTKQIVKLIARLAVAAVLLAWVFSQVDLDQFRQTARTARWDYLGGVWLLTALFSFLQAYSLQIILREQDCRVGLRKLFGATCVTAYYSLILPGIVSTGIKWYILKLSSGKGKGPHVLSAMLYNQVTLSLVMLAGGLAALIVVNPTDAIAPDAPKWVVPVVCGTILVGIVVVLFLALYERTGGPVLRLLSVMLSPLPRSLRQKGRDLLQQIAVFQTAGWRFHSVIALLNAIDGLLVGLLMYWSASRAAHVDVPLGMLIWLCAIVFVLGKIPVSVANLGVREMTLVGLLGLYGVDKSAALLMSMVMFSGLLFMAALGAAYQLVWGLYKR